MEVKTTAASPTPTPSKAASQGVIQWAGERFGIQPGLVLGILRDTVFKTGPSDAAATDAECAALLVVAKEYGLNPFTKEIFAFKDKFKGIVPIVSVDGWANLVNSHKDFNGVEFETGEEMETPHAASDGGKRKCFKWVKCRMFHKGREKPIEVTEYFDEVYQEPRGQNKTPGPWQTHPKRMHRHKAYIQCARLAFGFAGIYDEDEAERIIGTGPAEIAVAVPGSTAPVVAAKEGVVEPAVQTRTSGLAADLLKQAASATDADVIEPAAQTPPVAPGASTAKAEEGGTAATAGAAGSEPDGVLVHTKHSIEQMLEDAKTMDDTQAALEAILNLEDKAHTQDLMKKWNDRVKAIKGVKPAAAPKVEPKPAPAGQKPAGTAVQCDEFIDRMTKAAKRDELDRISDETRGFRWSPGQKQLLTDKYTEMAQAIPPI